MIQPLLLVAILSWGIIQNQTMGFTHLPTSPKVSHRFSMTNNNMKNDYNENHESPSMLSDRPSDRRSMFVSSCAIASSIFLTPLNANAVVDCFKDCVKVSMKFSVHYSFSAFCEMNLNIPFISETPMLVDIHDFTKRNAKL